MNKKNKVLEIFLDKLNILLYVYIQAINPNTNDIFTGYTIYDNAYTPYIVTKKRMDMVIQAHKKRKHTIEAISIDTYYFKQGGAVRLFTFCDEEYYIFLNREHKYSSPLYTLKEYNSILHIRNLYKETLRNIYLGRTFQIPLIKNSFVDFLEHFVGEK